VNRSLSSGSTCRQGRGELDPGVEPGQLAFELYAALELANYLSTLERDPAVVERGRNAVRTALAASRSRPSPGADSTRERPDAST
jgi:hypothetical protein